jgi:hypothetical protein
MPLPLPLPPCCPQLVANCKVCFLRSASLLLNQGSGHLRMAFFDDGYILLMAVADAKGTWRRPTQRATLCTSRPGLRSRGLMQRERTGSVVCAVPYVASDAVPGSRSAASLTSAGAWTCA